MWNKYDLYEAVNLIRPTDGVDMKKMCALPGHHPSAGLLVQCLVIPRQVQAPGRRVKGSRGKFKELKFKTLVGFRVQCWILVKYLGSRETSGQNHDLKCGAQNDLTKKGQLCFR